MDDFPAAEYRYFDRLRRLYEKYKFDGMPLDQAEYMKRIAFSEYLNDTSDRKRYLAVLTQYQHDIRQCVTLRSEALKSDDIRQTVMCLAEIVSFMTGDENFKIIIGRKEFMKYE